MTETLWKLHKEITESGRQRDLQLQEINLRLQALENKMERKG